jgi:hypothetical protein
MNLGTQLKWFHDFWTFTQIAKICQSLVRKLIYKPMFDFQEKKPNSSVWPATKRKRPSCAAQPRAVRAHAAHGRGKPTPQAIIKHAPVLTAIYLTKSSLFPQTVAMQEHPSPFPSLHRGGPRRPSARRHGGDRHWPVTPATQGTFTAHMGEDAHLPSGARRRLVIRRPETE